MKTDLRIITAEPVSAARADDVPLRVFGKADALAIARDLMESEAGAHCHWSASALNTVATIILWEAVKGDAS